MYPQLVNLALDGVSSGIAGRLRLKYELVQNFVVQGLVQALFRQMLTHVLIPPQGGASYAFQVDYLSCDCRVGNLVSAPVFIGKFLYGGVVPFLKALVIKQKIFGFI